MNICQLLLAWLSNMIKPNWVEIMFLLARNIIHSSVLATICYIFILLFQHSSAGRNFGWHRTDWFGVRVVFNSNRLVWSQNKKFGCLLERKLLCLVSSFSNSRTMKLVQFLFLVDFMPIWKLIGDIGKEKQWRKKKFMWFHKFSRKSILGGYLHIGGFYA